MHVYFSGIGGTGIGPLAQIAKQAGIDVSGSDKQNSNYIDYLKSHGIQNIEIGQTEEKIASLHEQKPIDWIVYSSALIKENPDHPELDFARKHRIRHTKRDDFINWLVHETGHRMLAIAGTHGKTTTTAMCIWLFKQLQIPVSYSVGAKMSFGEMGEFKKGAKYFIYEADEYDKNFLSFSPEISIISGIAYDHPDIYPTREDYEEAFRQFSRNSTSVIAHKEDLERIGITTSSQVMTPEPLTYSLPLKLVGDVNRKNAALVIKALNSIGGFDQRMLADLMSDFPGVSRRFERISENIYSDYAHTPEKIKGAIGIAQEIAPDNLVIVYEGLHNTRQHFIKEELKSLFAAAKKLYVVPSYLAREDQSLEMLDPEKLCKIILQPDRREPAELNASLSLKIQSHAENGDLVLCLSAGGGGSLDEWLRANFIRKS